MSFSLLGASWLWMLPLAALPVVFHLAWRQRKKRVPVPSLVFFHRLQPRLHARRRLRDLLVLLLRCLVLLAVLLALARPAWSGWGGSSACALVLVIDNSASMTMPASAGQGTRLSAALADAGALLAALGPNDRAGIITTVADPLVPALSEPIADRARLRAVLDAIHETAAAGAPGEALARASALVAASTAVRREVHVLSDLQDHEWSAAPAGAPTLPAGAVLVVHRIGALAPATCVTLAGLEVARSGRLAGRPTPIHASLENSGSEPAVLSCTLSDDTGGRTVRSLTVPAHGHCELSLATPPAPAGGHWAHLHLEGAQVPVLGDGYIAYTVGDRRTILLAGAHPGLGLLPLALAPTADGSLSGLTPRWVAPDQLGTELKPAIGLAVLSWEDLGRLDAGVADELKHWVEAGGRLLAVPRADAPPAEGALPSWLDCVGEPISGSGNSSGAGAGEDSGLVALDPRAELFHDLVDADGAVRFPSVRVHQALALHGAAVWTPLLGLDDGRPLLVGRDLGHGSVIVSGLAFSPRWSNLPLMPAFLALAQALALPPAEDGGIVRLLAGERVGPLPAGAAQVVAVSGAALDWQGTVAADGTVPGFPRTGVYAISTPTRRLVASVRADPGEGRLGVLEGASVPALGATPASVSDCISPQALVATWRAGRSGIDLAPWLLALAAAAVMVEGLVANITLVVPAVGGGALGGAGGDQTGARPAPRPGTGTAA